MYNDFRLNREDKFMDISKSAQLQEANNRLETLVNVFNLNPNLLKYWNGGIPPRNHVYIF